MNFNLGTIDWNTIAAIATASGTLVALWSSWHARRLGARAAHLRGTLDRLLAKPHLTDGVITTGVGAMKILSEVVEASNLFFRDDGLDFGGDAERRLMPITPLLALVRLRDRKVRAYIDKLKANGKLV